VDLLEENYTRGEHGLVWFQKKPEPIPFVDRTLKLADFNSRNDCKTHDHVMKRNVPLV